MAISYPTLGSETFQSLSEFPQPVQPDMVDITRPGVNSTAYAEAGERAETVQTRSVQFVASWSDAKAKIFTTYPAMVSNVYAMTRNGVAWCNCFVKRVRVIDVRTVATPVGGHAALPVMLTAEWTLEARE